jgi:hypothetical protein
MYHHCFNKNIENDRFRCCPYCYNSFNFFSRSDAAEEKLAQTSSYLQDCLSKQLFIEKHKVTGQHVDIYAFQMILQFVVRAFEEESSLLLPEVYERYKLLLHKNDLNIVIDSDKDMSKLFFLSPSGQFGLMSDDLPKIVNGNFLKHLHHFCKSDDQGFSFFGT